MEIGDRLREKYTNEGCIILKVYPDHIRVRMDNTNYIFEIYERIYKFYEKE